MIKESEIQWSKDHHRRIRDGGMWAIPRSGLIMRKTPEGFELVSLFPWMPLMAEAAGVGFNVPATADQLLNFQRLDFGDIQSRFEAAGLTFSDPKNLLGNKTIDDLKNTLKSGKVVRLEKVKKTKKG